MIPRRVLPIALVLGLAILQGGCSVTPAAPSGAKPPPNIIIVLADDLGYGDLQGYGSATIRTPNLDALAAEGQRWTDFYATAPVCSPTRGTLMTGQWSVRSGLYGNALRVFYPGEPGGIPGDRVTIAQALKAAGYDTAIFGKWHLGDAPAALPTRYGFDHWVGVPYSNDMDWALGMSFDQMLQASLQGRQEEVAQALNEQMQLYFDPRIEYWNIPYVQSETTADGTVDRVLERPADQHLLVQRYTALVTDYIRSRAAGERAPARPFFIYLAHNMPHTPLFRSDMFVGKSAGGRYGDVIEEIDWSIGEIRRALIETGLADNTLLVFTSDNGPWLVMLHEGGSAGPLRDGKGTTFEGGMRVPGIFWWPGTVAPGTVREVGTIMDLFATAVSLAGGTPAPVEDLDSIDLSGVLLGNLPAGQGPRQELPYYRGGTLMAYRAGRYKIHFVTEGSYGLPPARTVHDTPLLYDLVEDPGETRDIAADHPDIVQQLVARAREFEAGLVVAPPLFDRRLIEAMREGQAP